MRSHNGPRALIAAVVLIACFVPATIAAGTPVDPSTLTPVPPDGAACWATGRAAVVCHTRLTFVFDREPMAELSCGLVVETSTDVRTGIRWYDGGKLAARHVTAHLEGEWFRADGIGPRARVSGDFNTRATWAIPGDDATARQIVHGKLIRVSTQGIGADFMIAGYDERLGRVTAWDSDGFRPEGLAALERAFCQSS